MASMQFLEWNKRIAVHPKNILIRFMLNQPQNQPTNPGNPPWIHPKTTCVWIEAVVELTSAWVPAEVKTWVPAKKIAAENRDSRGFPKRK